MYRKIFAIVFGLMIIMIPFAVSRAAGLVPNCGIFNEVTKQVDNPCNFEYLMEMVNNAIQFTVFYLATPLAALCFAYAGFLYLVSAGSVEKKKTANKIIMNVLVGYLIVLAAWLIVKTILVSLGYNGPMFLK